MSDIDCQHWIPFMMEAELKELREERDRLVAVRDKAKGAIDDIRGIINSLENDMFPKRQGLMYEENIYREMLAEAEAHRARAFSSSPPLPGGIFGSLNGLW